MRLPCTQRMTDPKVACVAGTLARPRRPTGFSELPCCGNFASEDQEPGGQRARGPLLALVGWTSELTLGPWIRSSPGVWMGHRGLARSRSLNLRRGGGCIERDTSTSLPGRGLGLSEPQKGPLRGRWNGPKLGYDLRSPRTLAGSLRAECHREPGGASEEPQMAEADCPPAPE